MTRQAINIGAAANDGTGDDLRTGGQKINENFEEVYNRVKQVTGLTLLVANWTLVSGLYEYDLADVGITANSVVNITPVLTSSADLDVVNNAQIFENTESSVGSVKLKAISAPTADINVVLTIIEKLT